MKLDKKDELLGSTMAEVIDNRVMIATLAKIIIEKGIVTQEELDEAYQKVFAEMKDEYAAELLGISIDEYRKRSKNS
ncbi:hypothetical protein [Geobacillus thermodenitrificans]|uniref:hypothetical protein n=1 Tax=Geobacillus thermodenitrificans TaxID=33940 RepID=UPI00040C794D|nr:hypothetical protein [Geobacillus thermodenitrificans]ARA99117.1 hypothetical protein GD3902_14410 [Geobacillus thermodenitrificans]